MNNKKILALLMLISSSLAAQDVSLQGSFSYRMKIPATHLSSSIRSPLLKSNSTKEIKLLNIKLSDKAQQILSNKTKQAFAQKNQYTNDTLTLSEQFPSQVQLNMNGVPVLDQGSHGTCVTFAITAAIDALFGKGDYISQLCQLQLGNYLEANGYGLSGWNGAYPRTVLNQIETAGIVSKEQQKEIGCGDLIEYPLNANDPKSFINLEEFHRVSEPMADEQMNWWPILDIYNAINNRLDTNTTLSNVKESLQEGDRVAFAVLLLDFDMGVMGAVGKKGDSYDSWVLTPEIARDVYLKPDFGGHEMIITGYDDNAIAIDDQGRAHKGLLTLRNSWGKNVGDEGNFYMSYDYFKLLVLDAQRIHKVESAD